MPDAVWNPSICSGLKTAGDALRLTNRAWFTKCKLTGIVIKASTKKEFCYGRYHLGVVKLGTETERNKS
jgi:hypothetical protein